MFNSSLDAYGAIRKPTAVHDVTGGQNAVNRAATGPVELKAVANAETKLPVGVDKATLATAVNKLNELVSPTLQNIEFVMDEEADRVVVKVVGTVSKKVLRQIPNEEVLAFSKTLGRLQGLVIRQTA